MSPPASPRRGASARILADVDPPDVDIGFLDGELAGDVEASLGAGFEAHAVFEGGETPDDVFRAALGRAITAIAARDQDGLLPRFLRLGPYEREGPIPSRLAGKRLADDEVARAIRFIHSSAINCFQGALAELLAVGALARLAKERFPGRRRPRLFVGDTVLAPQTGRRRWAKAADFHLLRRVGSGEVEVAAVAEVKSFCTSFERLAPQLSAHLARASRGLLVGGEEQATVSPRKPAGGPLRVAVVPDDWPLSRRFAYRVEDGRKYLQAEPTAVPRASDDAKHLGGDDWLVTLRWSQEALASQAYDMTFWYMGELGRVTFAAEGLPRAWNGMTPEEAGCNAAKASLYYAVLRARTVREASRAIALYNSYGFGYALGASFLDRDGRREILFAEDLAEILATGRSRTKPVEVGGVVRPAPLCRIRGFDRA